MKLNVETIKVSNAILYTNNNNYFMIYLGTCYNFSNNVRMRYRHTSKQQTINHFDVHNNICFHFTAKMNFHIIIIVILIPLCIKSQYIVNKICI